MFIKIDNGPASRITDSLYLGNLPNAESLHDQKWDNFWAVLNCTDDPALDYMKTEVGFDVMRLNQLDGEPYPGHSIKRGLQYIDENLQAGSNVLVCCHAGVSRSPGMVVAYLMYSYLSIIPRKQQTFTDKLTAYKLARDLVRNCRPFIEIHPKIDESIRRYFGLLPHAEMYTI